jgi:hypothetical protein
MFDNFENGYLWMSVRKTESLRMSNIYIARAPAQKYTCGVVFRWASLEERAAEGQNIRALLSNSDFFPKLNSAKTWSVPREVFECAATEREAHSMWNFAGEFWK